MSAEIIPRNVLLNPWMIRLMRPFVKALRRPTVNRIFRPIVGWCLPLLLGDMMCNVPVVGKFKFMPFGGKTFCMESDGYDSIVNLLYWKGFEAYDKDAVSILLKLASKSRKIFDIGANTGLFAIMAANDNSIAEVHAFEPNPRVFKYMKRNVEANSLKNLVMECSALTNFDGEVELYIPSDGIPTTSSTLKGFRKASEIVKVPAVKLDTYCGQKRIEGIDLLKIDTEGTEHLVIEGGVDVIKRDQPIMICEVLNGLTEKFLQKLLDDIGYEYYWISSNGLIRQKTIVGHSDKDMNYLFVTRKRKKLLSELRIL